MANPLKVIIIGCGKIAGGFKNDYFSNRPLTHASAFSLDKRFQILSCVDTNPDKLELFMKKWEINYGYKSIDDAFQNNFFDMAVISSPSIFHESHLLTLLNYNIKLVLCEKPLGLNYQNCKSIVEEFHKKNISLAVNFTRRWDNRLSKVIDDIRKKKYGKIRKIIGLYNKGLINNGSHLIDIISRLTKNLEVVWVGNINIDYDNDDPTLDVIMSSNKGFFVNLIGTDSNDFSCIDLRIVTTDAILDIQNTGIKIRQKIISKNYPGYHELGEIRKFKDGYSFAMQNLVDNLHKHLKFKTPLHCSGSDVIMNVKILDEIARWKKIV